MFPSGTVLEAAEPSNTPNSPPSISPSGSVQSPQVPTTPIALLSQMIPNDTPIPPTQDQYHGFAQMQYAQQQSQQYSIQMKHPGHSQNTQHVQLTRMQSSSDDEAEGRNNENPWQEVRSVKRKKAYKPQTQQRENIKLQNRYNPLPHDDKSGATSVETPNTIPKPPPIFVYGVVYFPKMILKLQDMVEMEKYTTRNMANNTIRKLVKFMNVINIIYHTYQTKEERAYTVVIKYLHHSIDTKEVAAELFRYGHKVRNMINVRQRQTKEQLNLFFVDLEPADNNDIYKIRQVLNSIVQIEPPKINKNIVHCLRCQQYGHTKTYCNRPYVFVKCGGLHSTASCCKRPDVSAKNNCKFSYKIS